jgi:hypothetical protein
MKIVLLFSILWSISSPLKADALKSSNLYSQYQVEHQKLSALDLRAIPDEMKEAIVSSKRDNFYYIHPLQNKPRIVTKFGGLWHEIDVSKIPLAKNASSESRRCWNQFVSGSEICHEENPIDEARCLEKYKEIDLLKFARQWTEVYGLALTTEQLYIEFGKRDDSKGLLERRLAITTQDKDFKFKDSFATIPLEKREKIGVFFILGIGGEKSRNAELIKLSSEKVESMGFASEVLEASSTLGSDYNANVLRSQIKEKVKEYDKIIFVAASKGVSDFVHYFLNYSDDLNALERAKIKVMVSLSGVTRDSQIASWITDSRSAKARLIRTALALKGQSEAKVGLKSLSTDQWEGHDPKEISKAFPKMTWISMPMLPDGSKGHTERDKLAAFIRDNVYAEAKSIGPSDGLVETAGSVLPPHTGLNEWVVRAYGPHGLALGTFKNGTKLAPENVKGNTKASPEAGPEILDAFFRALPTSVLK